MATKKNEQKTEEKVTVILNHDPDIKGAEAEQEFFSVNFKNYLVKTDEPVKLSAPLAEVVQNKNKARRNAMAYARKMAFKDSKPPV